MKYVFHSLVLVAGFSLLSVSVGCEKKESTVVKAPEKNNESAMPGMSDEAYNKAQEDELKNQE